MAGNSAAAAVVAVVAAADTAVAVAGRTTGWCFGACALGRTPALRRSGSTWAQTRKPQGSNRLQRPQPSEVRAGEGADTFRGHRSPWLAAAAAVVVAAGIGTAAAG